MPRPLTLSLGLSLASCLDLTLPSYLTSSSDPTPPSNPPLPLNLVPPPKLASPSNVTFYSEPIAPKDVPTTKFSLAHLALLISGLSSPFADITAPHEVLNNAAKIFVQNGKADRQSSPHGNFSVPLVSEDLLAEADHIDAPGGSWGNTTEATPSNEPPPIPQDLDLPFFAMKGSDVTDLQDGIFRATFQLTYIAKRTKRRLDQASLGTAKVRVEPLFDSSALSLRDCTVKVVPGGSEEPCDAPLRPGKEVDAEMTFEAFRAGVHRIGLRGIADDNHTDFMGTIRVPISESEQFTTYAFASSSVAVSGQSVGASSRAEEAIPRLESTGAKAESARNKARGEHSANTAGDKAHSPQSAKIQEAIAVGVLTLNDLHGRIGESMYDSQGLRLAISMYTAIEDLRSQGILDVLILSTGDNIGASTFVSGISDDVPTLTFLDLLGVNASAVGNHEFDRGWAALKDQVVPSTNFSYLGGNVLYADSGIEALDPYKVLSLPRSGVRIGIVGLVTDSTPRLSGPAGLANLSFHSPAESLNQIAPDVDCDAIIVLAHLSNFFQPPDTLQEFIAADPESEFSRLVMSLPQNVAAVFGGHSHTVYSYQSDNGVAVSQAGSYGQHFGVSVIRFVPKAGTSDGSAAISISDQVGYEWISAQTEIRDVPRDFNVTDAVAKFPEVARIAAHLSEVYDYAASVEQVEFGKIAKTIEIGEDTEYRIDGDRVILGRPESPLVAVVADAFKFTAFFESQFGLAGVPLGTPPPPDPKAASGGAYGTLVGRNGTFGDIFDAPQRGLNRQNLNTSRDTGGEKNRGTGRIIKSPDLAIINVPSVRESLHYDPSTRGKITPRHVFNALPFSDRLLVGLIDGKALKEAFEQIWSPAGRQILLGVSSNVRYYYDALDQQGNKIKNVLINGEELDLSKTYRIVTTRFLNDGGDGFSALTGLVDKTYLESTDQAALGLYLKASESESAEHRAALNVSGRAIERPGDERAISVHSDITDQVQIDGCKDNDQTHRLRLWSGSFGRGPIYMFVLPNATLESPESRVLKEMAISFAAVAGAERGGVERVIHDFKAVQSDILSDSNITRILSMPNIYPGEEFNVKLDLGEGDLSHLLIGIFSESFEENPLPRGILKTQYLGSCSGARARMLAGLGLLLAIQLFH